MLHFLSYKCKTRFFGPNVDKFLILTAESAASLFLSQPENVKTQPTVRTLPTQFAVQGAKPWLACGLFQRFVMFREAGYIYVILQLLFKIIANSVCFFSTFASWFHLNQAFSNQDFLNIFCHLLFLIIVFLFFF